MLFIKGEFLYKIRTKLHIKITQHDGACFSVLTQSINKAQKDKKNSLTKENVKKADLHKAVLNKTMTTQE